MRSADGLVLIGANQDTVFARLCAAMDQPALAEDARYASHTARGERQQELDALIEAWTRTQPTAALLEKMHRHSVPAGLIYRAPEMLEDPHFRARQAITAVEHPEFGTLRMQNVAPKLSSRHSGRGAQPQPRAGAAQRRGVGRTAGPDRIRARRVARAGRDLMDAFPVELIEVGPRDGLQNESAPMTTALKLELVNRLLEAGLRRIEVCSFVHPGKVPQMADAEALCAALPHRPGARYAGLVLNLRGYERALAAGRLHEVGLAVPATDSFGRRNQGQSTAEALAVVQAIAAPAPADGLVWSATIAVAFGCPFEGEVAAEARGWHRAENGWPPLARRNSHWPIPSAWPCPDRWNSWPPRNWPPPAGACPCAGISTTPATPAWPMFTPACARACAASTPAWADWAAAPSLRPPPAMSLPRTWSICCERMGLIRHWGGPRKNHRRLALAGHAAGQEPARHAQPRRTISAAAGRGWSKPMKEKASWSEVRSRMLRFVEDEVYPMEPALDAAARPERNRLLAGLMAKAKAQGLWALGHPREIGGQGMPFMDYVHVNGGGRPHATGPCTWPSARPRRCRTR